jgi:alpha-1,3-rhamnosyl/mannosyltransferase
MRIVIDATPILVRSAGVKNYLYHWLQHLRSAGGEDTFRAYPFIRQLGELNHDASVFSSMPTLARLALLHFANLPGNPTLDLLLMGSDVFHASNLMKRSPNRVRVTATIHDMTCWVSPELHNRANIRADRGFANKVLRKASGIITVSEHTRSDLLRIIDIAPERVRTIYPGVPPRYFEATERRPPPGYGLDKPYILSVGTIEPRNNIETLLEAYEALPEMLRREYDFVAAGPIGWSADRIRDRLVSSTARYLGYVPEADLPALTGGARLFVYPSLYEGFGFPVAQAMAAGVPVITSAVSSLPEIAAGSAMLVDPRSVDEIRRAMERVLEDAELAASLASRGRERARCFQWENCARQSLEFFEDVVGHRN